MIAVLLLLGLAIVGAVCFFGLGGRLPVVRGRTPLPEQPHRQAIHHFASGVLPPWR